MQDDIELTWREERQFEEIEKLKREKTILSSQIQNPNYILNLSNEYVSKISEKNDKIKDLYTEIKDLKEANNKITDAKLTSVFIQALYNHRGARSKIFRLNKEDKNTLLKVIEILQTVVDTEE